MSDTTPFTLATGGSPAPSSSGQTSASVSEWLNVQAFGAKGDGSTDDTAALQATIDACDAAKGGKIVFPRGNYVFNHTLTVRSHQTWEGANQYATTLEYRGDLNTNWLHGVDVEHWTVRDLGINGSSWGALPTGAGHGIFLERSQAPDTHFIVMENVHVQNVGGAAFKMSNPIVSRFVGCVATNCGSGFDVEGVPNGAAGTSTVFVACYANACGQVGYRLFKMAYSALVGCAADHNGRAYHVESCDGIALVAPGSEDTTVKNGMDGAGIYVTDSRGVVAASGFSYQNPGDAVHFTGNSVGFVLGTVENTPAGSATSSIHVDTGCTVALPGNTGVSPVILKQ